MHSSAFPAYQKAQLSLLIKQLLSAQATFDMSLWQPLHKGRKTVHELAVGNAWTEVQRLVSALQELTGTWHIGYDPWVLVTVKTASILVVWPVGCLTLCGLMM